MEKEQLAEMIKDKIFDVEQSFREAKENPDRKITTVHLGADLFLKMAYLFVGMHGK